MESRVTETVGFVPFSKCSISPKLSKHTVAAAPLDSFLQPPSPSGQPRPGGPYTVRCPRPTWRALGKREKHGRKSRDCLKQPVSGNVAWKEVGMHFGEWRKGILAAQRQNVCDAAK